MVSVHLFKQSFPTRLLAKGLRPGVGWVFAWTLHVWARRPTEQEQFEHDRSREVQEEPLTQLSYSTRTVWKDPGKSARDVDPCGLPEVDDWSLQEQQLEFELKSLKQGEKVPTAQLTF